MNKQTSIFNILTDAEFDYLNKSTIKFKYQIGEYIYKENDKATGLIIIESGKVKIFKERIGGRENIVRLANKNEFIGYKELFAETTYIESAQCIENSIVEVINKNALYGIIKRNGEFALSIIKSLSKELGFTNSIQTDVNIRNRLIDTLLFLIDAYGIDSNGFIDVYLSREELGSLSNITTRNVIKILSDLASKNLIEISGRKLKIIDIRKLK